MNLLRTKAFRRFLESVIWIFPDEWVIKCQYRALVGRWPDLKNPKRFTEKIDWYKLNYRDQNKRIVGKT